MLNTFFRKASSFFFHLRKGTAGQRIQFLYNQWRDANFWLDYPGLGNSFVYPLKEGVRLRLYRDDRLSELIYKEDFESNERALVCHYLKPGMCFLDVGANIGLYTLISAKIVGSAGLVVAVEPASKTYRKLLDNIKLNGFENVRARQVALSDQDEIRELITYSRRYHAWNSLGGQIVNDQRVRKERVECICLDRFISEADLENRVNLMKIDVEGWEWFVLTGGINTLQIPNAPDILIEFTDLTLEAAGSSASELYNLLMSYRYSLYRIDSARNRLISEPFGNNHPYDNYFATQNLARALELSGYSHVNL